MYTNLIKAHHGRYQKASYSAAAAMFLFAAFSFFFFAFLIFLRIFSVAAEASVTASAITSAFVRPGSPVSRDVRRPST